MVSRNLKSRNSNCQLQQTQKAIVKYGKKIFKLPVDSDQKENLAEFRTNLRVFIKVTKPVNHINVDNSEREYRQRYRIPYNVQSTSTTYR